MVKNKDTDNGNDDLVLKQRERSESPDITASKSENSTKPPKSNLSVRKQTVIQPVPDNSKEEFVESAHAAEETPPPAANTTTIPSSPNPDKQHSEAESTEPEQPQIPTEESSKLTSVLPTKDHLESMGKKDGERIENGGSGRSVVIVLLCMLVVAALLGVAWSLLTA